MNKKDSIGVFYFDIRSGGVFLGAFGDDVAKLPRSVFSLKEKDALLLFEAFEKVYDMGKRHGKQ